MAKTYQDYEEAIKTGSVAAFLADVIAEHRSTKLYKTATIADAYNKQLNVTIMNFTKKLYSMDGSELVDFTASNTKICSNFFHRLNSQRCSYSLGNGVSYVDPTGDNSKSDEIKKKLGLDADYQIYQAAYKALIHGVSFVFLNMDKIHVFPITEFAPLYDEETGALRAGVRFWRVAKDKPLNVVFYEKEGYSRYKAENVGSDSALKLVENRRSYKQTYTYTPIDGYEIIDGENYSDFPIVPMWGSEKHQSTLVGMRGAIDSYDLIKCGFADDLKDVALIYWIVNGAANMTDDELSHMRDRILFNHIAYVDEDAGSIQPHTQDVPYTSRDVFLNRTRSDLYEDFAALDVHTVSAGATNDHIDMAYQSKDEEAAEFEHQIAVALRGVLALLDIEATPVFKRMKVSNQMEQVQMVAMESQWLDQETILHMLPNVKEDQIPEIMERLAEMEQDMFNKMAEAKEGPLDNEDGEE